MPEFGVTPHLIIAAVVAASVWQIQEWRYASKEKDRVQQELVQVRFSAASDIRRLDNTIKAQSDATLRERRLRDDAASSRTALISLSDAAEAALRAASASHASCIVSASAFRVVLDLCGVEYRGLAETADRHANDAQTLIDAWPK